MPQFKNEEEIKRSAERLALLLTESQMSQADLCRAIDEPRSNVSRWLTGERGIPQWTAQKIAKYFKVSPGWIMGFDCDRVDVGFLLSLLDTEDRARVVERINTLLESEKYKAYLESIHKSI